MLSSRLQELFDEFLYKIKEQFDNVSLTGEINANQNRIKNVSNPIEHVHKQEEPGEMHVNQSKIKKERNTTNFGYQPEELSEIYAKQNKLKKFRNFGNYEVKQEEPNLSDKQPSFLLRKKDLAPGWFSPMRSQSSELRRKYQRSHTKQKNPTNKYLDERFASKQKKIEERRRKEEKLKNVEPNIERNECKAHKTDGTGFYDGNMKKCICKNADLYDNKIKSRRSRDMHNFQAEGFGMHPIYYRPKEEPIHSFSNFTFDSTYTSSN